MFSKPLFKNTWFIHGIKHINYKINTFYKCINRFNISYFVNTLIWDFSYFIFYLI